MWFKNPFKSKRNLLYLFPLAFACITLFPMFGKGMFMDGVLYAIISQNVAQDICGLWSLKITESLYPHFNEHPPLVFALQSFYFKHLGNHYWVERLYSLSTIILSSYLIVKLYRLVCRIELGENPSPAWVLLLWISVPVVNRCAQNNMLENTMLVFVLGSVWAYLKAQLFTSINKPFNRGWKSYLWLFVSGFMLFWAFMAKGFTGLFPFSLPIIFTWFYRLVQNRSHLFDENRISNVHSLNHAQDKLQSSTRIQLDFSYTLILKIVTETLLMIAGFVISFFVMMWVFPESVNALQRYFQKQVVGSLAQVQTVSTRFKIIGDYILALLPMLLISVFLGWILFRRKNANSIGLFTKLKLEASSFLSKQTVKWLLLLSLSGVIPIMISLKQSDYYIYCVFPFAAMAVVIGFKDYWLAWEKFLLNSRKWPYFMVFICLVFGGWGFVQAGKVQRDKELWTDINSMVASLNQKEGDSSLVLGSFRALKDDWYMQAYLYRYFNITVQNYRVPNDEKDFKYFLVPKNYTRDSLKGLVPLNREMKKYELWQKNR